ncbi:hypothetical protein LCGC14_1215220 [marine sediment metagenome]|uniref:Uncharacterized protein n=1 Tax=marine sediment metagenome TaxID=412755 RepID=A0A0F9NV55_9ZZZZ
MLENRFTRDFIGVIMLWLVLLLLLRLVPLLRKPPPGEFDVEAFLNLSHNPHPLNCAQSHRVQTLPYLI